MVLEVRIIVTLVGGLDKYKTKALSGTSEVLIIFYFSILVLVSMICSFVKIYQVVT